MPSDERNLLFRLTAPLFPSVFSVLSWSWPPGMGWPYAAMISDSAAPSIDRIPHIWASPSCSLQTMILAQGGDVHLKFRHTDSRQGLP